MPKKIKALLAAILLNSFVISTFNPVNSVPLNCGDTIKTNGVLTDNKPEIAGLVIADRIRPFTITLSSGRRVTGKLQDRVVKSKLRGTLIFAYRVVVDDTSSASIKSFVRENFNNFSADTDWAIAGLGTVAPTEARRTSDCQKIEFDFTKEPIGPGQDSRFFYILTNATDYDESGTVSLFPTGGIITLVPSSENKPEAITFKTFQPIRGPRTTPISGQMASLACGKTVPISGTQADVRPDVRGAVIIDKIRPFAVTLSSGKRVTGKLQDRVIKSQILGTLFFSYTIFVDSNSGASIVSISRDSFKQFSALADWREDGVGTVAPTEAMRTSDCSKIQFNFAREAVGPGALSRFFYVQTDATSFNEKGTATLIITDGKQSIPFRLQTFQPTR